MITIFIIILTVGISFYAFGNPKVMNDYLFLVHRINNQKEYFRFISSGFIHADFNHLLFNMITLFSFGSYVEAYFDAIFPSNSKVILSCSICRQWLYHKSPVFLRIKIIINMHH
ncbi:MAG: rhomboid family intramembrane serine protease [Bacteroidetes bacterium]|nr:rhomboid family intramembrane serine protease [Bacteroidota bacterium]